MSGEVITGVICYLVVGAFCAGLGFEDNDGCGYVIVVTVFWPFALIFGIARWLKNF